MKNILIVLLTFVLVIALISCDTSKLPDSHTQALVVLVDLSGTSVGDRPEYVEKLESFIRAADSLKPNVIIHVVGFSGFVRPIGASGGQAQAIMANMSSISNSILNWPPDPTTNPTAAFEVACELLRKAPVDERVFWILSDGIPDPRNEYRTRTQFAVPVPRDFPFSQLKELKVRIHWDELYEFQFSVWQQAFDANGIPNIVHMHGYSESAATRLTRLPRSIAEQTN